MQPLHGQDAHKHPKEKWEERVAREQAVASWRRDHALSKRALAGRVVVGRNERGAMQNLLSVDTYTKQRQALSGFEHEDKAMLLPVALPLKDNLLKVAPAGGPLQPRRRDLVREAEGGELLIAELWALCRGEPVDDLGRVGWPWGGVD